jgi:general secretion pathway protein J
MPGAGQRSSGFTLVELLVALAIFAVLGLASWKVIDQAIRTKQVVEVRSHQLQQWQKALWLIGRDLHSIIDRPIRNNLGTPEPALSSLIPGFTLVFTRQGWHNALQAQRSELQRVAYGLETDDKGDSSLMRYYWHTLDRAPDAEPVKQVLINNIDRLEVQFIDDRGQTAFYWPPSKTEDDDSGRDVQVNAIPSGIRLRLTSPAWGEVERVFQLRDSNPS